MLIKGDPYPQCTYSDIIFWKRRFFVRFCLSLTHKRRFFATKTPVLGPVHTYLHIFEKGEFYLRVLCLSQFQMHPAPPPPPPTSGWPPGISIFWPWMANSGRWGLLSCQMPQAGDEKRGQMPRSPSTLQHFSLIAQSNSAVLSILMCDLLFQLTSSFVIALGL